MRVLISFLVALALAGCVAEPVVLVPAPPQGRTQVPELQSPRDAARNFVAVVEDMVPVARQECRRRTRNTRCDYQVLVDDRRGVPPNAFFTLSPDGQPVIGFTLSLIAITRNRDELAFVLGHEAAHHIEGHIPRGNASAAAGAALAGALATAGGASAAQIRQAQNFGAFYGQRQYAKQFELEADALGAVLTERAGYDALRGAQFFVNSPDPGNRFLGTHPPNADRIATVRRAVRR